MIQESLKLGDASKLTAEQRRKQEQDIKKQMLAESKKNKKNKSSGPAIQLDISDDEDMTGRGDDD